MSAHRRRRSGAQGTARLRLRRAAGALALCAAALAAGSCAADAARPSVAGEALGIAGAQAASVLPLADGAQEASLPDGFEDEAVPLAGCEDVRADEGGGLVGFSRKGDAADALAWLRACAEEKGWTAVESGLDGCATFVKGKGRYRWMLATCTQAGDWSSVVVQYATAPEGD